MACPRERVLTPPVRAGAGAERCRRSRGGPMDDGTSGGTRTAERAGRGCLVLVRRADGRYSSRRHWGALPARLWLAAAVAVLTGPPRVVEGVPAWRAGKYMQFGKAGAQRSLSAQSPQYTEHLCALQSLTNDCAAATAPTTTKTNGLWKTRHRAAPSKIGLVAEPDANLPTPSSRQHRTCRSRTWVRRSSMSKASM